MTWKDSAVLISPHTAKQIRELCLWVQSETIARRLWHEVLSDEARNMVGGNFVTAYRRYGTTLGIFRVLNPKVSGPRAVLEISHELGVLPSVRYFRLVAAIGEQSSTLADDKAIPRWKAAEGKLYFRGGVARVVRRPKKASSIVAILDAFETADWPTVLPLGAVKGLGLQAPSQYVYSLNDGLKNVRFAMNGSGDGITWALV